MNTRIHVSGKRTVPTYTTLRAVSWYAFELAKSDKKARVNHMFTSMAFDAFTIEAYLNHIGSLRIPFWKHLKRKLNHDEKLAVISTDLAFNPDKSRAPWQSFGQIFKLRSLLVHAETETLSFEAEVSPGTPIELPLASWEEFMKLGTAERFLNDAKAMITDLAFKAGLPPEEVFAKDSIEAATSLLEDGPHEEPGPA